MAIACERPRVVALPLPGHHRDAYDSQHVLRTATVRHYLPPRQHLRGGLLLATKSTRSGHPGERRNNVPQDAWLLHATAGCSSVCTASAPLSPSTRDTISMRWRRNAVAVPSGLPAIRMYAIATMEADMLHKPEAGIDRPVCSTSRCIPPVPDRRLSP